MRPKHVRFYTLNILGRCHELHHVPDGRAAAAGASGPVPREVMNTDNLRRDLPRYDTQALAGHWSSAEKLMQSLGERAVFRAMSIGTRRILFQAIRAMGARSVLDIGTYTGTSALAFALAVGPGGRVVTVDVVDANADDGYWSVDGRPQRPSELMVKAGVSDWVEFVTADANDYLRSTDERFDFICIDSAKSEDDTYEQLPLVMDRLNPGGLVFMDDVFADGKPMPSGYYEAAHWNVLTKYRDAGAIKVLPITSTLEGARVACAWVLRP